MQELYRINDSCYHKPWRYNSSYYVRDKELFDLLIKYDGGSWTDIAIPEDKLTPEDIEFIENEGIREYLYEKITNEEIKYPFVLLGDVTLWSE